MNSSYIHRLSDDILCTVFKLISEEDQVSFNAYAEKDFMGMNWDDWGDECGADSVNWNDPGDDSDPPRSALLQAMKVCNRWHSLLSRTPSMWAVLQISFRQGAAALEHARTFLRYSGSCPLHVILLWDNPSWVVRDSQVWDDTMPAKKPRSREEIMAGVHLISIIQELYGHVHRWRDFTLRTTSITHVYQALSFMSSPSVHPARILEKLHIQFVHNERHAAHFIDEPLLFPGSVPPIRNLLLFGISWAWLSSSMLSYHLVDMRIHYDIVGSDGHGNVGTGSEAAKDLTQLLRALVNLQTLALEIDLHYFHKNTMPIELPHLHSLAIKSRSMASWAVDFLHTIHMPDLRILTLCVSTPEDNNSTEGVLDELARLTDSDADDSSCYLLELDELHLLNFRHLLYHQNAGLLHRLYTQMATVETLTLGPGEGDNLALAMGLLPTSGGLADLPLPGLRTLIAFDVPKHVMRHIVLERMSLAGPMEEIYCCETQDKNVPDDWQHQVEKYHRIGHLKSYRYYDIVGRQWSHL
ncbi:hypothetical protein DFH29DRAFT_239104 [Suillus ampliporus]|nr:hypothetical protein DFH29DRAFT_239104 [Suillus ampliporus]